MKAEQRKELETNTLADRMGNVMQRVKSGQRRTYLIYAVVVAALIVGAWIGVRYYRESKVEQSAAWLQFYDGAEDHVRRVASEKDTAAGKAARLQIAWHYYWYHGVKQLGTDKDSATKILKEVAALYGSLVDECKDDPVFEPQAMLGRAVATESLAVQDPKLLKTAEKHYKELTSHEKYKDSAEGKFAAKRLEILDDPAKSRDLELTYVRLRDLLRIQAPIPGLPFDHPNIEIPKKP